MRNYDQSVKINHNPNWSYVPNHPYRIKVIGGTGSEKLMCYCYLFIRQRSISIKTSIAH